MYDIVAYNPTHAIESASSANPADNRAKRNLVADVLLYPLLLGGKAGHGNPRVGFMDDLSHRTCVL
jgi:hypothetical protein